MIKKLHLTCKDKTNINNEIWLKCLDQYRKIYNDYEIIIYDNNDIYNIINKYYPEHLEKIKQIKIGAILADIFRYLILYLEGGIYSDMDCEPLKKIDNLFTDVYYHGDENRDNNFFVYSDKIVNNKWDYYLNPCNNHKLISNNSNSIKTYKCMGHKINNVKTILCYEFHMDFHTKTNWLSNKYTYNGIGICQWFMITEPLQDIFIKMFLHCINNLDKLEKLNISQPDYHYNVINTCGPLAFTKVVLNNKTKDIYILPSDFFCCNSGNNTVPITKNSYIKHHFTGSWLK
jgi:hypothetical protein